MNKRKRQQKCLMMMMSTIVIHRKLLMKSFLKKFKIKIIRKPQSLRKRRSQFYSKLWMAIHTLTILKLKLKLNLKTQRPSISSLKRIFNSQRKLSLPQPEKIRSKFLLNHLQIPFISEPYSLEPLKSQSV